MENWISMCERGGNDPIEVAFSLEPPGANCRKCQIGNLVEAYEADHPVVRKLIGELGKRNRMDLRKAELGLRVVKGGAK
jgi:hypothetical protein